MEAAPPSYEKATLIDPWDIIARYIPSNDLCSAALVCSTWHTTFTPHLWGNPASHFGIENDRVYVALTIFKRTLQTARLLVRSQTHTLHLPPAHAELYNGPHAHWLRDILARLPNLQSLIVRGLPFFDYSALQALRNPRPRSSLGDEQPPRGSELPASPGLLTQRPADFLPSFGLRLLDASRCPNVTSSSLAQALGRFDGLLYLDLSFTYAARDPVVLKTLKRFHSLQVVKLRGISLNDDALAVLATSVYRRVRSLDIRNNFIGDKGVQTLLDNCFTLDVQNGIDSHARRRSQALIPYLGHEMLDIYQGEDFESFIRNAFTGRFINRLAIEEVPEGGITHLYIAGNQISVEGVSDLIRTGRLHVLDVQSVDAEFGLRRRALSNNANKPDFSVSGVDQLTAVMSTFASSSMTFLRIDHSLVTEDNPHTPTGEIVQGRTELADTAMPDLPPDAFEMDATSVQPEAFELPTVQTPKYELPGDPMQFIVSPAINDPQHQIEEEESPTTSPRRGSAFAPEVLDASQTDIYQPPLLSPVSAIEGGGTVGHTIDWAPVSPFEASTTSGLQPPVARPAPRQRTYSSVADERRARLNAHIASHCNLHPAMLPHLTTLVLTGVPPFTSSSDESNRLIHFIRQCAEEAQLARHQAQLDYSLPPGRRGHAAALKHAAEKIFALKRIVLELGADQTAQVATGRRASQWNHRCSKSVTEDRDSDSLWSSAETDFSFFADEQEESFPSLDAGRYAHTFGSSEKEISSDYGPASPVSPYPVSPQVQSAAPPNFDNVALLSAFRKERNLAHRRCVAAGAAGDVDTEGYWDGAIQIIRPSIEQTNMWERQDYYGNRFDKGHLYD